MPLVYLPDKRTFFSWGAGPSDCGPRDVKAQPATAELVAPSERRSARGRLRRRTVEGRTLPLLDTVERLAVLPAVDPSTPSDDSLAAWTLASKLALDLVARERVVPAIERNGTVRACWRVALSAAEDAASALAVAHALPPAAHAVPVTDGAPAEVWAPEALLREFLDGVADALVRRAAPAAPSGSGRASWELRWRRALASTDGAFETHGFAALLTMRAAGK